MTFIYNKEHFNAAKVDGFKAMALAKCAALGIVYDLSRLDIDTITQIRKAPAMWRKLPTRLFSIGLDAKTSKGAKLGFMTGVQYLAPHVISGFNVCANSELAGCRSACLYSAGRGAMSSVQMSRLRKTLFMQQYPAQYSAVLFKEVGRVKRKADRAGLIPLIRLNGTSDIRFERTQPDIFKAYSDVTFYDYTKLANRRDLPANYDLTFSYSGMPNYQSQVKLAIDAGMRIAVVFQNAGIIPKTFLGLDCVDGDDSDVRHIEPQNVITALYGKGAAKHDRSGFVVWQSDIDRLAA